MRIVKLNKKSGGGEYFLIPVSVLKCLMTILYLGMFVLGCILIYHYLYLPAYASYYVTETSRVLHNRKCGYFGTMKGFYVLHPENYQDCKSCGGRNPRWLRKEGNP